MGQKVKVNGGSIKISREKGHLYFTKGDPISIYGTKMQHKGRKKGKQAHTLVLRTSVRRDNKYIYYVDSDGCLARAVRKSVR